MGKMTSPAVFEYPGAMIGLIRCSRDGGELVSSATAESGPTGVIQGSLRCAKCATEFFIRDGIVRLLPESLTGENQHEMELRDSEYEQNASGGYKWGSKLGDRIEVLPHLRALGPLEGKKVLEFGCGDGRFTIPMAQLGADVLGVDFSLAGLYRLAGFLESRNRRQRFADCARSGSLGNLNGHIGLVQGDATRFFPGPRSFDRALSATPLDARDERMRVRVPQYCGGIKATRLPLRGRSGA